MDGKSYTKLIITSFIIYLSFSNPTLVLSNLLVILSGIIIGIIFSGIILYSIYDKNKIDKDFNEKFNSLLWKVVLNLITKRHEPVANYPFYRSLNEARESNGFEPNSMISDEIIKKFFDNFNVIRDSIMLNLNKNPQYFKILNEFMDEYKLRGNFVEDL